MSMSTYVLGVMEPDEDFRKMYAAYKACEEANVPIPDEVDKFFNYVTPDPHGMIYDEMPFTEYQNDMQEGIEIKVSDIPKKVTVLRFLNSY